MLQGRASLGPLETSAKGLNAFFFAPRWNVSRFQTIMLVPLVKSAWAGDRELTKFLAKQYVKMIIGYATWWALIDFFLGNTKIVTNPTSTDFLKVRVGDTRIDMFAGLQQATVFLMRTWYDAKTTLSGREYSLYGEHKNPFEDDYTSMVTKFLLTKRSPPVSLVMDVMSGHTLNPKEKVDAKYFGRLPFPITWRDIYDELTEQDLAYGLPLSILSFFGESVNNYKR
jgi:hypothetical protein